MTAERSRGAIRVMTATLAVLAIAGCSVDLLPEKQALRIFTLPYDYAAIAEAPPEPLPVLKVVRPRAAGVLGGKRIVIEPRPNELAAYGPARWIADAPLVLRDHLVRALRDDPRLSTVVSDTSGSGSDVTLTSELLAFQEVRHQGATVRIYLQAQLVENGSRRTMSTEDFDVQIAIGGDGIEAVVTAFGKASDQLSGELAQWISGQLASY